MPERPGYCPYMYFETIRDTDILGEEIQIERGYCYNTGQTCLTNLISPNCPLLAEMREDNIRPKISSNIKSKG